MLLQTEMSQSLKAVAGRKRELYKVSVESQDANTRNKNYNSDKHFFKKDGEGLIAF